MGKDEGALLRLLVQADYIINAIRALATDASARRPLSLVSAAHAEFVATLGRNTPRPLPIYADADDLQDRADHLEGLFTALSAYLATILDDTAQNVPGGLDVRQIEALLSDLASEVSGTSRHAIECAARRVA
jgi:hypothetical protein